MIDPSENVPSAQTLPITPLRWSQDFVTADYITDSAKTLFSTVNARKAVLTNIAYQNNNVAGVLYGAMLKTILGGKDDTFMQQGATVGLMFKWYAVGNNLLLSYLPINDQGKHPGSFFPPSGDLFTLLAKDQFNLPLVVRTRDLLTALGFPTTFPIPGATEVLTEPVIVTIDPNDGVFAKGPYFAVATLTPGNAKPYAYGPPCPPVCYG